LLTVSFDSIWVPFTCIVLCSGLRLVTQVVLFAFTLRSAYRCVYATVRSFVLADNAAALLTRSVLRFRLLTARLRSDTTAHVAVAFYRGHDVPLPFTAFATACAPVTFTRWFCHAFADTVYRTRVYAHTVWFTTCRVLLHVCHVTVATRSYRSVLI